MSKKSAKALAQQLKLSWTVEPETNILFTTEENNVYVWHCLMFGLPEEFFGGEYIIRLQAKDDFPSSPPSFKVLTPNGAYEIDCFICISVGEFHVKDYQSAKSDPHKSFGWRPSEGMLGFARECMNGMICDVGSGMNVLRSTKKEDFIRLAGESVHFNVTKYPEIMTSFESLADANPDHPGVKRWRLCRALRSGKEGLSLHFPDQDITGLQELHNTEYVKAMLALNADDEEKLAEVFTPWKGKLTGENKETIRSAIIAHSKGKIEDATALLSKA